MSVFVEKIVLELFKANCYIVHDGKDAVIIDAGSEGEKILEVLNSKKLNLLAILLTHGHHDHVRATTLIKKHYPVDVYIHKADEEFLLDPALIRPGVELKTPEYTPAKADAYLEDGQVLTFGSMTFEVIHVPGHSDGSCFFICEDLLFSGDTLQKGKTGLVTLYKSNEELLHRSVIEKIFTLQKDFTLLPGHRESSTLFEEKSQAKQWLGA